MLALTSAIFASAMVQTSSAQSSPEGTWEFSLSRARNGTAVINFNPDFTMDGMEITSKYRKKRKSDVRDGRPGTGTREEDEPESGGATETSDLVGSAGISGVWTFDDRGKVVGHFGSIFALVGGGEEEEVMLTTNGVSFRAVVRPGRSIKLMAYTGEGRVFYRGRPSNPGTDISGDYISSTKTGSGSEVIEFLNFSSGTLPNEYDITGTGPGFAVGGSALLTSRGQMSLMTLSSENVLTAATGRFNSRRMRAFLKGTGAEDDYVRIYLNRRPD